MSRLMKHHQELKDGKGKCSVPMWMGGCPAGFCDKEAYGYQVKNKPSDGFKDPYTGEYIRFDGKYTGYCPGLACPGHGGPKKPKE